MSSTPLYACTTLFFHSHVYEYLSCFKSEANINKAANNIGICHWWTSVFISLGKIQNMWNINNQEILILTSRYISRSFIIYEHS